MIVYSLPATLALAFKLVLLWYAAQSRAKNEMTRLFLLLLIVFSLFNLSEVFLLNYFPRYGLNQAVIASGYAYFVAVVLAVAILLHLSLRFALAARGASYLLSLPVYLPALVLVGSILLTDRVVSGFQPFQFTIIRVPGPLYFLFESYITLYLSAAVVNLVIAARDRRAVAIARLRSRLWLTAVAPMALLMIYLIFSRHLRWPQLSSQVYVPIAQTFFLVVAAYATHQYRLFEIEFFLPWSKVRKRKTAFYQRIQQTIAEIASLGSVQDILQRLADTLRCPVALFGGVRPMMAFVGDTRSVLVDAKDAFKISDFPPEALKQINGIVVAQEIQGTNPDLYALMRRHHVGVVVPFVPRDGTASSWMAIGDHFSEEVYTPLDFRLVERLFDRIADRFLDKLLLLRDQLEQAHQELWDVRRRLAMAWGDKTTLRKELARFEAENRHLRRRNAELLRDRFALVATANAPLPQQKAKTLGEHMADFEAHLIRQALHHSRGDQVEAARLLGISPEFLNEKMGQIGTVAD